MTTEEKENLDAYLKGIVLNLPDSPGCYQYLNDDGEIIYVGKAKNLKRRVYSYFSKDHQSRKTAKKTRFYWKTTLSNAINRITTCC